MSISSRVEDTVYMGALLYSNVLESSHWMVIKECVFEADLKI